MPDPKAALTAQRFVQQVPELPDTYMGDHVLRRWLDRLLGSAGHAALSPQLSALAEEAATSLRSAADSCERRPPRLVQFDAWGRRIDVIETDPGWDTLRAAAARHGLVALPYEQDARSTWGAGARVAQHALLHLFGPDSSTFNCPVAMSDGAAAVLREGDVDEELRSFILPRLLSRNPDFAWTSGQWMTESQGGSDVGRAATQARQGAQGWALTGEKWFCSATTAEVSIALARPEGRPDGSTGLACFVIPRYADVARREPCPRSDRVTAPGLLVHRLKDKLGTRALPSAEVGLQGAAGWPVGDPDQPGLRRMMTLVQVTRLHNAAAAAAGMRRGVALARTYAGVREAFGAPLWQQPLHRETLTWMALDAEGAFALTSLCFQALGRLEVDGDQQAAARLRLAATLAKACTGKWAMVCASEAVECFGGAGYVEDTGLPRLLRDSQILSIWEGTTNVLSLDLLRVLLDQRMDALGPLLAEVRAQVDGSSGSELAAVAASLAGAVKELEVDIESLAADPLAASSQARARSTLMRLGCIVTAGELLAHARHELSTGDRRGALVAELWVRRRVLGEECAGEGHAAFGAVVDGHRC